MALQNFVDFFPPSVKAAWLNAVDALKFTVFDDATTKQQATTNLLNDLGAKNAGLDGLQLRPQLIAQGVDSGVANAAAVTLTGPLTTFQRVVGTKVSFTPVAPNTGAATLNVNATGVAPILAQNGTACTGGELSLPVVVEWTGTDWQIIAGGIPLAYRRTPAEAGLTIVDYTKLPGHVERYVVNTVPGTTDMAAAFLAAFQSTSLVTGTTGTTYRVDSTVMYTGTVNLQMTGVTVTSNVVTFQFTDANNSTIAGIRFMPLSTPFTILRNPASWNMTPADITQKFDGYMPNPLDTDIWPLLTPSEQATYTTQYNTLHPGIYFKVSSANGASNLDISGIRGFCVFLCVEGYTGVNIHDCDYGSTGWTFAAILLNNGITRDYKTTPLGFTLPRGVNNRVVNNNIRYASLCGVTIFGQDDCLLMGNVSSYHGESGYKTSQYDGSVGPGESTAVISLGVKLVGNWAYGNFYDGFDVQAVYTPIPITYFYRALTVCGNRSDHNRHTGYVFNGAGASFTGNIAWSNGTYGISAVGWDTVVTGNHCQTNMTTGITLVPQPFDIFLSGDGIVSGNNQIFNPTAPAVYNYFHSGFGGGAPAAGQEGLDFSNYCSSGLGRIFIRPEIKASQVGVSVDGQLRGTGSLTVSGVKTIATATYTVQPEDSSLSFSTAANCVVTMPSPVLEEGRRFKMRNTAAFTISSSTNNIGPQAGGAPTTSILPAGVSWCEIQSDGVSWIIMASG